MSQRYYFANNQASEATNSERGRPWTWLNIWLDASMIQKFIPAVLEFVEQHAGPQIKQILEGRLKR